MALPVPLLRTLPTDNDFVSKRVTLLETWAQSGEIEPWMAVVLAEWFRLKPGAVAADFTIDKMEDIFLNDELLEVMREQVDGPWMVYFEQARAQRSNNVVMGFLVDLEEAVSRV